MKVFLTGGTGFTGSHLAKRLIEDGHKVRALARPSSNIETLKKLGAEIITGDMTDRDLLFKSIKGVDWVFNIAAAFRQANLPDSQFFAVNCEAVKSILDACMQHQVQKFVHCSTIGVITTVKNPPADENSPVCPGDVYQKSKYAGELEVLRQAAEKKIPATVIRPCAIYGPGDLRMLKLFKMVAKKRFLFFGSGNAYLHTVFVENLVDGFILAAQKHESAGQVFIIGDEGYVTLNELVKIIAEQFDVNTPKLHIPYRPFEILAIIVESLYKKLKIKKEPPIYKRRISFFKKSRAFSIKKARDILGYSPKIDLKTGIAITAKWYIENGYI